MKHSTASSSELIEVLRLFEIEKPHLSNFASLTSELELDTELDRELELELELSHDNCPKSVRSRIRSLRSATKNVTRDPDIVTAKRLWNPLPKPHGTVATVTSEATMESGMLVDSEAVVESEPLMAYGGRGSFDWVNCTCGWSGACCCRAERHHDSEACGNGPGK